MNTDNGAPPLLSGRAISHDLGRGELKQRVLHGVSLTVNPRELVALTGTSGSGKSTLLYIMGALDKPTAGHVHFRGVELTAMGDADRANFRGTSLGYIFQFHFLLAEYTVSENVALPLLRQGKGTRVARHAASEALELLGLSALGARYPGQLSGGQQQRVAIARAIAHKPALVLADEPTGSLDARNADAVFAALMHLTRAHNTAVLMVTHDPAMAASCDRTIGLADGRIVSETRRGESAAGAERAAIHHASGAAPKVLSFESTGENLALSLKQAERADSETIVQRDGAEFGPGDTVVLRKPQLQFPPRGDPQ